MNFLTFSADLKNSVGRHFAQEAQVITIIKVKSDKTYIFGY